MKIDFKMFAFLMTLCFALGIGAFAVASKANKTAENQSELVASLQSEVSTLEADYKDYTTATAEPTATPKAEFYEVKNYKTAKSGTVTAETPMFSFPSTSSEIAKTIKTGTEVTVTAKSGDFLYITVDDETSGWIDKSFFKEGKEDEPTATPKATATPKPKKSSKKSK